VSSPYWASLLRPKLWTQAAPRDQTVSGILHAKPRRTKPIFLRGCFTSHPIPIRVHPCKFVVAFVLLFSVSMW
jgi:hypothetical protein